MTPFASQVIVVAVGLSVLGVAVHKRSRVAACVCLGLLLVFGSISGAIFYEQPGEAATKTTLAHRTSQADGLSIAIAFREAADETDSVTDRQERITALKPETKLPAANEGSPESVEAKDENGQGDESKTDRMKSVEIESQVAQSNPSDSTGMNSEHTAGMDDSERAQAEDLDSDVIPSNRSFIPLDGEEVPASIGTHLPGTPEWVLQGDYESGDQDYRLVTAGPAYRLRDCEKELNELLVQATNQYIDDWLEPGASRYVSYDLKYVKEHLLVEGNRFSQLREYQVGPMHSSYAQLRFDHSFREQTSEQWRNVKAKHRLIHTGLIGGSVLGLLVTVFGYFRLDHATRGLHTGRLQFLAGAAILTLVLSGAIAWRAIPWL